MSMFLVYEGEPMSFDDYCILSEALVPKETAYGVPPNCSDSKIDVVNKNITTWFKDGDDTFLVQIDSKGEFGFARHVPGTDYKFESGNYVMDQSLPMTNSLRVFNKVFYLILLLADKANIKKMQFSGSHDRLGVVYEKMMHNAKIQDVIHKNGWNISYEEEERKETRGIKLRPIIKYVLSKK